MARICELCVIFGKPGGVLSAKAKQKHRKEKNNEYPYQMVTIQSDVLDKIRNGGGNKNACQFALVFLFHVMMDGKSKFFGYKHDEF